MAYVLPIEHTQTNHLILYLNSIAIIAALLPFSLTFYGKWKFFVINQRFLCLTNFVNWAQYLDFTLLSSASNCLF